MNVPAIRAGTEESAPIWSTTLRAAAHQDTLGRTAPSVSSGNYLTHRHTSDPLTDI